MTVSGTTYKVAGSSKVTYTAKKKATATVTVPATVKVNGKTYKVTTIAANAFTGNKKMKKITVGKNIDTIGKNAFKNCQNPSPQKMVKQKGQSKSNLSKSSGN